MTLAPARLTLALLLAAAGLAAFAQAPVPAPAAPAAPTASAPAPASAPAHRRSRPAAMPVASALTPPPTWAELTPAQLALLAPLAADWDQLSPEQRSKWLNATPMLAGLPAPDLERVHERMRAWSRLTPAERANARVAFQATRQMLDDERRRAKWEAYQALPPEKRKELADRAAARKEARAARRAAQPQAAASQPALAAPPVPVPVAGGLVQARPGATTVLMTRRPPHPSTGPAKLVADPALVDPQTLLPKPRRAAPPASAPRQ